MSSAPSDEQILDAIRAVARQHLDHAGELTPDSPLVTALELDSLRMLTLVMELENHFSICLDEGDEDDLCTVADLVALLRSRLG